MARCTENFDHHCIWLNNCIGSLNYRWFIALIISLETYFSLQIILASVYINKFFVHSFFLLALSIILFIPISFIFAMHVYFGVKGISTYDYVMLHRKQQLPSSKPNSTRPAQQEVTTINI